MLHPLTFMYIKSFEDVRKFILTNTNINLLAELGLGGVFANSDVQVDACMYVLEKDARANLGTYFDLKSYKNHTNKPSIFNGIYNNYFDGIENKHIYTIPQSKLKIIKFWPFIYWMSDDFREKFETGCLSDNFKNISVGMQMPGCNEKYFRFFWEFKDTKNRSFYSKGGEYNKWWGNNSLTVPTSIIKKISLSAANRQKSFGVSSGRQSSKGPSFRLKIEDTYVDNGTMNIFFADENKAFYFLGLLNSKYASYVFKCLNPTVNKQSGDLSRIPFQKVVIDNEKIVQSLVKKCIYIKKYIYKFCLTERDFNCSPYAININQQFDFKKHTKSFLNNENHLLTQVLLNEFIINENIFEVYDLSDQDKTRVLANEGKCIGGLSVIAEARDAYFAEEEPTIEFPLDIIRNIIESLPVKEFTAEEQEAIESQFAALYQGNNTLEEFCIRHQVNPINVWYWFKQSNVLPKQRMRNLSMEFLADMIREILMEDEDGIISLVPNATEKILLERIEDKFWGKGFTMAQYSNFYSVLGHPINEYLNNYFFAELSDHLKLFKRLPATPFIWHLSSGPEQGFDCYIIIYKWSRDKLMRIRSVYIEHRERALMNRQSDLANNDSADAQNEKEKIFKQLKEIEAFKVKIDELLAEGYNPILDDGVGKNIAPLQKKKMIPYEVLNPGQLKKYLNADW